MPKLKPNIKLVQLRMSLEEKELLQQLAKKSRMSYSAYIRYLINKAAEKL